MGNTIGLNIKKRKYTLVEYKQEAQLLL